MTIKNLVPTEINGSLVLRTSGNTGATTAIEVRNSDDDLIFSLTDDGNTQIEVGAYSIRTITTDETLIGLDHTILVDASGGLVNVTLPLIPTSGEIKIIKKIDSSSNFVNIIGTIEGGTNKTIMFKNTSLTLQYDGSGWFII